MDTFREIVSLVFELYCIVLYLLPVLNPRIRMALFPLGLGYRYLKAFLFHFYLKTVRIQLSTKSLLFPLLLISKGADLILPIQWYLLAV